MKGTVLFFFIALLSLYVGCNSYCSGTKLSVGIAILFPWDSLSIYADSALIATKSVNEVMVKTLRDKRSKVAEICATKDSILIRVYYNLKDTSQHIPAKDTSFYIHVKEINGFSIAMDITHEIGVFLDDVNHGYGMYEPDSR